MIEIMNPIPSTAEFYVKPEDVCLKHLNDHIQWSDHDALAVSKTATQFIEHLRGQKQPAGSLESFMQSFSLSTEEGLAIMCLAEALLRVPDIATRNALIHDKITSADWDASLATSDFLVKSAGLGLGSTRSKLGWR